MTLTKKVAHNFILQIIGRILALILGLFVISLMMRYLGPRNYGYYSTAFAFLQVFGIIADFGLYLITLQYLGAADLLKGAEKEKRVRYIMGNIFTLRFFSALIFYGGAFALCWAFPYPKIIKLGVGILSGSLFFCTLIQALSAFYQKILRTEKIFVAEVLGKIITLVLMVLFVKYNFSFYSILSVFVLGHLSNFLWLFFSARKWILLKFRFDFIFWREILRKSWPVGLAIIFNVFYFKADTLILSFYQSPEHVGFYGACYRVLEVLITIPPLFLGLILPRLTKAWKDKDKVRLKILIQKSFDFLVMLSLPIVFATLILGEKIMTLIGGKEFSSAGNILKVVIIACGILFVAELFKHMMIAIGKQRQILPFYLITALLALTGYFIFIPKYSYWGAAWITVFSELLMFIFAFYLVWKTTKMLPNLKFFIKSLGASLIMFLSLFFLNDLNLFLLVLIGTIIYFTFLYIFKGIDKQMVKDIIKLN